MNTKYTNYYSGGCHGKIEKNVLFNFVERGFLNFHVALDFMVALAVYFSRSVSLTRIRLVSHFDKEQFDQSDKEQVGHFNKDQISQS